MRNTDLDQAYLKQLQSNPLRTKMLTSGGLAGLQEVLASWLAHDRSKHGHYFSSRVPKMMAYGSLISAPLGHALIGVLQWLFSNRTSLKSKIAQILISNLVVSWYTLLKFSLLTPPGLPNSKHSLPRKYGCHCWCSYIPSNKSYCSGWFHASYESQLDYQSNCIGICSEIPTWISLGTILQLCGIRHWNIYQHTYKEEETCSFEEEGRWKSIWFY